MKREKTNEFFGGDVPLSFGVLQKFFELGFAHKKRLLENDARVNDTVKREVAEGTGGGQETIHLFVGEQLGGEVAEKKSFEGNAYFTVSSIGKDEISNLLDVISSHDKISFIAPIGVSIIKL